ncbi:RNA-directed DNA polymerase, eukaryota, reverse transcriptase zinc-binding domain protein [Tanacetum coccineum]
MDNHSWLIMGDFNVTLKLNEHSVGDHCPAVLSILEMIKKINAPFRFISYVADKPEFLPIVSNLKEKLKIAQAKVDANPHDSIVKAEEAKILLEYKESMSDEKVEPITDIDELFSTKLTNEDNDMMFKEVTDVEIKEALFDIGDNKSLGPDGYSVLNAILITLVPKVSNASKVTEYRPIACCNVLYKCISKILTNRIKISLNKLVNSNQSAFIPKRMIQDNILLSQELLKGYDRKVGPKRSIWDVQKDSNDSWSWKALMDIRERIRPHIIHKIGNEKQVSMWYENWSEVGPLD